MGHPIMQLCLHQTTTLAAGFRKSVEGYARAGYRLVEVIPPHLREIAQSEGIPAARRLLSDLGLRAVSSGGVHGLCEPHPNRAQALDELRRLLDLIAGIGVDRMVCPCVTTARFTEDDYRRAVDNLREVGEIVRPYGVTAMLEFMRGSSFAGTLATSLYLTRAAAHPNIRSMFDFYHFWAGLSRESELDLIRPGEIHHVHFQDVPPLRRELLDSVTREIPGDGIAPLERTLKTLAEKGYTGPVSVELFYPRFQNADPFEIAAEIRRKSEPILKAAGVA
jgi:sugar phosphate isomerase/epimerase